MKYQMAKKKECEMEFRVQRDCIGILLILKILHNLSIL